MSADFALTSLRASGLVQSSPFRLRLLWHTADKSEKADFCFQRVFQALLSQKETRENESIYHAYW